MIGALVLLAAAQAPRIIEAPMPGGAFVCVQAIAPVPTLGPRAEAATRLLAATMARETRDFTRGTLLAYSLPGGDHIRCHLTEDAISVQVMVPEGQVEIAAALLESVVRRPTLAQAALDEARARIETTDHDAWNDLLRPRGRAFDRVRPGDVEEMREKLFRPGQVVLVAGGRFRTGEARVALEKRFAGWEEPKARGPIPEADPSATPAGDGPWLFALESPPFAARDAALPTRLLATLALGVGKGSAMHRIVRERMRLSYRQEALWRPTPDGFEPVLAFAHAGAAPENAPTLIESVRKALLADVDAWSESHRRRALGMAELVWRSGLPASPLYLRPSGPLGESLQDRTFLEGYWLLKTGTRWNAATLLETLKLVRVEDLRETAAAMVREAKPRIVAR